MFGRLRTEWRLKTGLTFGLLSYWAVIYYGVHVVSPFAVCEFDLSAVDRWVNFQPAWVWGYVTIYPFVAVVPWLAVERGDLWRYTFSMVFVIFVAGTAFFFFPVAAPRPGGVDDGGLYAWLVSIDPVTNAFPSLHCAMASSTALFAGRALAPPYRRRADSIWIVASWVLVIVIFYSTLATRQHYFADVVSGILLGCGGHLLARRFV